MILVDTSVWIDHLRESDSVLAELLDGGMVLIHPFVIGEIALGNLRDRDLVIGALSNLPRANVANDDEVLNYINRHALFGRGIGYVDAHLLAAARLSMGELWTRDRRLSGIAAELGFAFTPAR